MESRKRIEIAAVTVPILLFAAALLVFFLRRFRRNKEKPSPTTLQDGIAKLHCNYSPSCVRPTLGFHSLNRPLPGDAPPRRRQHLDQPVFSWDDHPTLVAEASDGGWSRFAFSKTDPWSEAEVGWDWEISRGSSEFMQAVRLISVRNRFPSGLTHKSVHQIDRTDVNDPRENRYCSVTMDLPLPGPSTENTSFPGEAYFEITVLYVGGKLRRSGNRGRPMDRLKHIFGRPESGSDLPVDAVSAPGERDDSDDIVALGLSRGGCNHNSGLVGTYSGSVGFFSDGSVYLDGSKLAEKKTGKYRWNRTNKIIGCGLNPKKKKVIFTLESEIIHDIKCCSSTFSKPLFPTLVANVDMMILVNLGQKPFAYKPSNVWRSPNPCLAMNIDDPLRVEERDYVSDLSQELFSIEGIDPHWRGKEHAHWMGNGNNHHVSSRSSDVVAASRKGDDAGESTLVMDIGDEESDLFEIDLVVSGDNDQDAVQD